LLVPTSKFEYFPKVQLLDDQAIRSVKRGSNEIFGSPQDEKFIYSTIEQL
jgi:hypothetical protein